MANAAGGPAALVSRLPPRGSYLCRGATLAPYHTAVKGFTPRVLGGDDMSTLYRFSSALSWTTLMGAARVAAWPLGAWLTSCTVSVCGTTHTVTHTVTHTRALILD